MRFFLELGSHLTIKDKFRQNVNSVVFNGSVILILS